jgi:hypothetical protein
MAGRRKKAETELVLALACGATPEQAAQKTSVSVRTVYRRLTETAFRAQVSDLRAKMLERAAAMLTAAGLVSVKTLTKLQESAVSESVRLGAARSTIELGCKMREAVDFNERLTALEARSQGLASKTTGGS